jgi:hypothetical protein
MGKPAEEAFRRLTLGDEAALTRLLANRGKAAAWAQLPQREMAMVRLGALIALDAPGPLYDIDVAAALQAGLDLDDLLVVLLAVAEPVGSARVFSAAPHIATAAGYGIEEELDRPAVPT